MRIKKLGTESLFIISLFSVAQKLQESLSSEASINPGYHADRVIVNKELSSYDVY